MGDYCGEPSSTGGRDQGIQFQGDLFPIGDGFRLVHYQLQLMNGQGINVADENSRKDLIGTIQFQPIQDLYIGAFGWKGDYVLNDSVTVGRDRWAIAAKYEHNSWSARAEYAHSNGKNISEADGWYAAVGVPVNDWIKIYGKYDVYREEASKDTQKTMYCIAPNLQIHKNLMLQLQYNYVDNKSNSSHWNEFWAEFYVRF